MAMRGAAGNSIAACGIHRLADRVLYEDCHTLAPAVAILGLVPISTKARVRITEHHTPVGPRRWPNAIAPRSTSSAPVEAGFSFGGVSLPVENPARSLPGAISLIDHLIRP